MNEFVSTILGDWSEVECLSQEWNDVLCQSRNNSVFLTWEWIDTWWRHYGKAYRPFVVVVHDSDGCIQGIAPMMLSDCPGTFGTIRSLQIIGQESDAYPEYLDLIVREEAADLVIAKIGSVILSRRNVDWHILNLQLVPDNSPTLELIRKWSTDQGGHLKFIKKESPYLPLTATFEEFLHKRGKNFRKRWRKKNNALSNAGKVRLAVAGLDISVDEAMAYLIELNRQRWGEQGDSFRSSLFTEFHKELCCRFSAVQKLHLVVMYVDERPVSARYDFVHNDKFWGYQSGWALEWRDFSVSYILLGKVIEWGINQGLTEYDFLAGNSEYKTRWAEGNRLLVNMSYYLPGPKGYLWYIIKETRAFIFKLVPSRIKDLVRQGLKSEKNNSVKSSQ